jgi:CSLREA domain-containing protein
MAAMAATSLIAMPADAAGNGKHVHGSLAHWAKQPGAVKARPGKGKHGKKKAVTAAAKKPNLRSGALAASITVNSIADDTTAGNTQCTLREALANANSNSDTTGGDCAAGQDASDVITITANGTITTASRLDVLEGVTINGPGEALLTVSGNNNHRVFYLYAPDESVTISNLTVSGGTTTSEPGAGIASFNTNLTLNHVTISGNTASSSAGGGLFVGAGGQSLTIQNSTLSGNTAIIGGGAYMTLYGSTSITDTTVTNNNASYGGGLSFYGYGIPSLTNVTISTNHASTVGGGIVAQLYGLTMNNVTITTNTSGLGGGGAVINHVRGVLIDDSRVTNNTAIDVGGLFIQKGALEGGGGQKRSRPGLVRPHGTLPPTFDGAEIIDTTISGNTASGNDAGGVFLYSGSHHILNSTISGNTAGDDGGGIYLYDGPLLMEDSTVANNQAGDHGGGIYAYDTMDIRHSTISGNSADTEGGNIYLYLYTGAITLRNSIVANGNAPSDPDIGTNGGTVNATYSLIETPSPNVVTDVTDITLVDPQLGPLQNNGGPTETMLLALSSPAVNTGDPAYAPPPPYGAYGPGPYYRY